MRTGAALLQIVPRLEAKLEACGEKVAYRLHLETRHRKERERYTSKLAASEPPADPEQTSETSD